MSEDYLSLTEKRVLREFKTQILQKLRREVLAVKIFGSKARGDSKKTSDIDVLLLLRMPDLKTKEIIFDIATQILIKHGVDLSVKIFSLREFQRGLRLEIPFYLKVHKEALAL
jgi:predicted nucleotidyltransferase